MGEAAVRGADHVIVTDDNPRSEDPAAIRREIKRGVRTVTGKKMMDVPDRRRAILMAVAVAGEGDVVLVLGKGHEQGQEAMGTVTPFDDRLVLAEALQPSQVVPLPYPVPEDPA